MNSYRIIDANINRVCEGLRVLEDISRFILNDEFKSRELRLIKHEIRKMLPLNLNFRESLDDIGLVISVESDVDKKLSIEHLIDSNFSRVQEAMRSLEENLKLINDYNIAKNIEKLRFKLYDIQKEFLVKDIRFGHLYGITCDELSKNMSNYKIAEELIQAGIKVIQYRDKNKSKIQKLNECLRIKELCVKEKAIFIINDDIDIAMIVKPDGVHIGQDDLPIKEVRKLLPRSIIGVSTHNKEQVKNAIIDRADYIGVGPIFETSTKINPEACDGLELLKWVTENTQIPVVAIGGINRSNVLSVFEKGAKTCAVIADLIKNDDIKGNVENFNQIIREKKYI